jgi:hypothetical protein
MSSFQWFCLALRIIGAWNFVIGLEQFLACFDVMHGFYLPASTQPFGFFLQGCLHIVVALTLMRFAPFLALFAYPKPRSSAPSQNSDGADA